MIDSTTTKIGFNNTRYVARRGLTANPLPLSRSPLVIDSRPSFSVYITHTVTLKMNIGQNNKTITLFVPDIVEMNILLDIPCLHHHAAPSTSGTTPCLSRPLIVAYTGRPLLALNEYLHAYGLHHPSVTPLRCLPKTSHLHP